ncbi:MAG: alpha/beta hydrolase [Verrucomicrobiaceae bacterium]|nr:alpha/beta hydrolase [Verrucomicrobiaceae bacterium]
MEETHRTPPIDRGRELLKSARQEVYKCVGGVDLPVYIWEPAPEKAPPYPKAVAAFFFSSGWDHGQVSQFAPHCVYLASRGMMAMCFDYRVSSKHGTGPLEVMADVRSAFRWIRMNDVELGINPGKVVGIGGSGAGHAVAAAAVLEGFDDPGESRDLSHSPNACVLFNPVMDTWSRHAFGQDRWPDNAQRKACDLIRAIKRGFPPMLIMHGTEDRVVPFAGTYEFARKCAKKKNICKFIEFEGKGHGFFNFNVSFEMYEATLNAMDEFFVELGLIEPDPDAGLGREEVI